MVEVTLDVIALFSSSNIQDVTNIRPKCFVTKLVELVCH